MGGDLYLEDGGDMYIHQSVRMCKTLGAGTHRMHVHVYDLKYIHVHPPMDMYCDCTNAGVYCIMPGPKLHARKIFFVRRKFSDLPPPVKLF